MRMCNALLAVSPVRYKAPEFSAILLIVPFVVRVFQTAGVNASTMRFIHFCLLSLLTSWQGHLHLRLKSRV